MAGARLFHPRWRPQAGAALQAHPAELEALGSVNPTPVRCSRPGSTPHPGPYGPRPNDRNPQGETLPTGLETQAPPRTSHSAGRRPQDQCRPCASVALPLTTGRASPGPRTPPIGPCPRWPSKARGWACCRATLCPTEPAPGPPAHSLPTIRVEPSRLQSGPSTRQQGPSLQCGPPGACTRSMSRVTPAPRPC